MTTLEIQAPDLTTRLKQKLIAAVRDYEASRPRSQQVAVGASEIGSPCDRQLALKSLGYHEGKDTSDPWARIIGTAVHFYLEKVYRWDNERDHASDEITTSVGLWKVETKVQMAPGVRGTADLFDVETRTVIDHKVPADSGMDKVRKGDVSETYRVQIQCYGYGFEQLGYRVDNVALAFWPRGKGAWLGGLELVAFPYARDVAIAAISRWHNIVNAAIELDIESHPERTRLFATADAPCAWCPFHRSLCAGHRK